MIFLVVSLNVKVFLLDSLDSQDRFCDVLLLYMSTICTMGSI